MPRHNDPLTTFRDMARLYDIRDVLHLNGRKRLIVCPLPQHVHHHRSPSFSIYTTSDGRQKFRCHGNCGLEGDVIDLVGYLQVSGYHPKNGDHVKQAVAILSGGTRINPPKPEPKIAVLPNGLYKQYLPALEAVLEYARSRFLTPETLTHFHVGQHSSGTAMWMTMPTIHGNQLRGIKMRNLNATNKRRRFTSIEGSIDGLFNYNAVEGTTEAVLIVKGEIPVMTLHQHGILACAPTGGESSYHEHEELLKPLAFSRKRIVVADNDINPEVREKMVLAAMRRREIFKAKELIIPPDPYVGIDDFVNAEPEAAIPFIKHFLE